LSQADPRRHSTYGCFPDGPSTFVMSAPGRKQDGSFSDRPSPKRTGGFRPNYAIVDRRWAQKRSLGFAPISVIQGAADVPPQRTSTVTAAVAHSHKGGLWHETPVQSVVDPDETPGCESTGDTPRLPCARACTYLRIIRRAAVGPCARPGELRLCGRLTGVHALSALR